MFTCDTAFSFALYAGGSVGPLSVGETLFHPLLAFCFEQTYDSIYRESKYLLATSLASSIRMHELIKLVTGVPLLPLKRRSS